MHFTTPGSSAGSRDRRTSHLSRTRYNQALLLAGIASVLITNCGKAEYDRENSTDTSGGSAGTPSDSGGHATTGGGGGRPATGGRGGAEGPAAGGRGDAGTESLAGQGGGDEPTSGGQGASPLGGQGGSDDPIEGGGEGGAITGEGGTITGEGGVAGSDDDGIPGCKAIGSAGAAGTPPGVPLADQANTENLGWYSSGTAEYRVGQTFTVDVSGRLVGIQTSPSLFYGASPSDELTLDLYACSSIDSCSSMSLGSKTISAENFPLYDPATLTPGIMAPGYFDLCALELQVQAGEVYLFQLTGPRAPSCEDGLCTPHPTGTCEDDVDCWEPYEFAISLNGFYQQPLKGYPKGRLFQNGTPEATPPYNDLNFVTYVAP